MERSSASRGGREDIAFTVTGATLKELRAAAKSRIEALLGPDADETRYSRSMRVTPHLHGSDGSVTLWQGDVEVLISGKEL